MQSISDARIDVGSESDEALVQQAKAGDEHAFKTLYQRHVGRVFALCLRMTADRVRAEELTQDAFVRAWRRLGSFRGASAFSTWLYRIAVNVVLVSLRTEGRRRARFEATDDFSRFAHPDADRTAVGLDLEYAIKSLPPRARLVLILHDIEGYRHREIARALGIAAGTSKAHLFRARQLLKRILER